MRVMAACLVGQLLLGYVGVQPWLLPDLLVIGLVHVISRRPAHWMGAVCLAAASVILWTTRSAVETSAGYVVLGFLLRVLRSQWDAPPARVQPWLVAGGSLLVSILQLWLDRTGHPVLFGLSIVRAASTWGAAWLAQRLVGPSGAPERTMAGA